jgi:hypothetical protein
MLQHVETEQQEFMSEYACWGKPLYFAKWVEKSIDGMTDKKATEDYEVPGDVLKLLGEDGLTNDTAD